MREPHRDEAFVDPDKKRPNDEAVRQADPDPRRAPEANDVGAEPDARDRRRESVVDASVAAGLDADTAELMFDIALEEGLDPTLALELIRSRLAVDPPDGADVSETPVTDRYLPTWLFPSSPPGRLERERQLRFSFRRLRGFLESEGDVEAAFQRFAAEPDVRRQTF